MYRNWGYGKYLTRASCPLRLSSSAIRCIISTWLHPPGAGRTRIFNPPTATAPRNIKHERKIIDKMINRTNSIETVQNDFYPGSWDSTAVTHLAVWGGSNVVGLLRSVA